jgi:hypothetical protein
LISSISKKLPEFIEPPAPPGGFFCAFWLRPSLRYVNMLEKSQARRGSLGARFEFLLTRRFSVVGRTGQAITCHALSSDAARRRGNAPTDQTKRDGEEVINGHKTVKFVVDEEEKRAGRTVKWRHTRWVDPDTKLPVQLEITSSSDNPQDGKYESMIRDIVFNKALDPALFSIDLPPGYIDLDPVAKKAAEDGQELLKNPDHMITMQFTLTENYKSPAGHAVPQLTKQVNMLDIYLERDAVTLAPADASATSVPDGIEPNIRIRDGKHSKVLVLLPEKKQYFNPAQVDFAYDYIDLLKRQQGQSKPACISNAISQINLYS